jgi:hypothetical protein
MNQLFQMAVILLITGSLFFSCKKNSDSTPAPILKTYLKTTVYTSGSTTETETYDYDAQNRISNKSYSDGTISNPRVITQYDANNRITEYFSRTYSPLKTGKFTITYDAQGKLNAIEVRDSISPTIFNLYYTVNYSYPANKIIRTTNFAVGTSTRNEYFYNTAGQVTALDRYNISGTKISSVVYTNYDDKQCPFNQDPLMMSNGEPQKNNPTAFPTTNTATGVVTNWTATYTYNNDGYPTQIIYNNGTATSTYTLTYIKK